MNYREKIRKAIECPQFGDRHYGEWGVLSLSQRRLIKRLLNELDNADVCVKKLYSCIKKLQKENEECKKDNKRLGKDKQDRFIKYLEDKKISPTKKVLNSIDNKNQDYNMYKNKLDNYEEILQKYKEIVNGTEQK